MTDPVSVLIVDDSPLVRKIVSEILAKDERIKVLGTAADAEIARHKINKLNPDVLTLDIEMPGQNGLDFLREIMAQQPRPVIMMSVLTHKGADPTFQALDLGAFDFVPKPSSIGKISVNDLEVEIVRKVLAARSSKYFRCQNPGLKASGRWDDQYRSLEDKNQLRLTLEKESANQARQKIASLRPKKEELSTPSRFILEPGYQTPVKMVLIGISTGGPNALASIITQIPKGFPAPILIVQHMPEAFTKAFATRLNKLSAITVKEAEQGEWLAAATVYVAPGGQNMRVKKESGRFRVALSNDSPINGHKPSVDCLFDSCCQYIESLNDIIAVIMTGMGKDGAKGIRNLRQNGAFCVAQDMESSIVFGMNREAIYLDGVDRVVDLHDIVPLIVAKL